MICGELCNFGGALLVFSSLGHPLIPHPSICLCRSHRSCTCYRSMQPVISFSQAHTKTPLGALSVVISAILSHLILKEKLTLFGWIGCFQCILGAIIIALNGPEEQSVSTISAFKKLFLAPGFLSYGSVCIVASLVIIFFVAPKYGKKSMIWYILVCSLIGGISVSCTQGLGACILTSIRGQNQVSLILSHIYYC